MNHVVAISGGKDSVAMALRLEELHPETPFQFVTTPTGDELPDMEAHMDKVAALLNAPVLALSPQTLFEMIRDQGMIPNFRARFCTRLLKIEPFLEFIESLEGPTSWYVGLRADEPERNGVQITGGENISIRYPLRDWGWGLPDVLDYLKCRGVTIPKRTDCGACFYQRLGEWWELWQSHPARFQSYVEIEDEIGHTFRSGGRDTWPAPLSELREEFERGRVPRKWNGRKGNAACSFCSR